MAGNTKDIENIYKLQKIDQQIEEKQAELADDTLQKKIDEVRQKKSQVKEKQVNVELILKDTKSDLKMIAEQDSQLAFEQKKTQDTIDSVAGDYRKVAANTQKLFELTSQRQQLDVKLAQNEEKLAKISQLKQQIEGAISSLSLQEKNLRSTLEEKTNKNTFEIKELEAEKSEVAANTSPDALELYNAVRPHSGKVVVSEFDTNTSTCTVCRATISNAGISKIRAEAPLSRCPNCRRIIVVR